MKYYYVTELTEADGAPQSWIEAFRVGTFKHRLYGELTGTMDMFKRVVDNFKTNVLGHEPVIDYNHSTDDPAVPPDQQIAAGWVKDMRIMGDRLQFLVEWTADAVEKIKTKKFKYFSPTYTDTYMSKETGADVGTVMWGGALTNVPFLPGLSPVALSEQLNAALQETEGDGTKEKLQGDTEMGMLSKLTPEQLKVWCDAFDATEGDDAAKASAAWTAIGVTQTEPPEEPEAAKEPEKKADEPDAEMVKLQERLVELEKEKTELADKLAKQDIENQIADLSKPSEKKLSLPPVVLGKVRILLSSKQGEAIKLSEDKEYPNHNQAMLALLTEVRDVGLVDLSDKADQGQEKREDGITDADRKLYPDADEDSIKVAKLTDQLYADATGTKQYKLCMREAYERVHGEKK